MPRPGLRWSDGAPLAAEDFVWSFQRLMDPATASPLAGVFLLIENAPEVLAGRQPPAALGVAAPDPRTVEIRLAQPAPYLVEMLAGLQAMPVPRHVIEVHGREWTRADRIVSNGPFVLAERVPQDWIRLRRNPHYHAATEVRLDEVYWYPTQDLGTTLRRFRAGELDQVLNFPPEQLDWLRRNMPDELRILPSAGVYFLVVNTARKPFDDARVRRALSLAIDREALTERLLRTGVKPAESFASPDFSGYGGITLPEQAMGLQARQAEARRLLAAAGFGTDRPLTVDYVYDTQEENRQVAIALGLLSLVRRRLRAAAAADDRQPEQLARLPEPGLRPAAAPLELRGGPGRPAGAAARGRGADDGRLPGDPDLPLHAPLPGRCQRGRLAGLAARAHAEPLAVAQPGLAVAHQLRGRPVSTWMKLSPG